LHHWVISYHPQFDSAGEIAGITALVLDVTAHRQVEAELQRSRRLLESVVDHIPAMIFLKRATDLSYEMFSPHGARMLGTSSALMIGKNDYDFTRPSRPMPSRPTTCACWPRRPARW
jgi:PAS domain-containing protein